MYSEAHPFTAADLPGHRPRLRTIPETQPDTSLIYYSRGKNTFDNEPQQRGVADFAAFAKAILDDVGQVKGEQFICAPMTEGAHDQPEKHLGTKHWRLKNRAAARRWIPFDYDGFKDAATFASWLEWVKQYSCVVYTTASHTKEKPRARAIFELSRAVRRDECIALGGAFERLQRAALGQDFVKFDDSVYRAEQSVYLPLAGSETHIFIGAVLPVKTLLSFNSGAPDSLTSKLAGHGDWSGWSGLPEHKLKDGEKRREKMLSWAGYLRSSGMRTQEDIERLCLQANRERMADLLNDDVVLDLARRYQTKGPPLPSPAAPSTQSTSRFNLRTVAELASLPPLTWHVKGLLPRQGLAALFGASGSGKSFLTLDLGIALSLGEPWFGYKTTQCPVIYVALEGTLGITQRLKAWETHCKRSIPDTFRVVIERLSLYGGDDVDPFAAQLIETGLTRGVIFIDTLAQSAPEADENGSQDMGRIIQKAQDLQKLTNSLVVLVHHTGKDASKGARGHSSLTAALDAAIEVRKDNGARLWSIAKAKDGVDGVAHAFRLESVNLGKDSDGDPVSSCVCVQDLLSVVRTSLAKPRGPNQKIAFRKINELLMSAPQPHHGGVKTIKTEEAISAVSSALTCDQKHKRERAASAINGLVGAGLIEQTDGELCLNS